MNRNWKKGGRISIYLPSTFIHVTFCCVIILISVKDNNDVGGGKHYTVLECTYKISYKYGKENL